MSTSIHGVEVVPLTMHHDARGTFTEVFRAEWGLGIGPVQWNAVASRAQVLRGVHLHLRHADFLIVMQGRASIGLADLRRGSPTEGAAGLVPLCATELAGIVIPPGVAHGFYFHEPSLHLYAVSDYWDPDDELGCRWDDSTLGLDWPCRAPTLSPRDAALGSCDELRGRVPRFCAAGD